MRQDQITARPEDSVRNASAAINRLALAAWCILATLVVLLTVQDASLSTAVQAGPLASGHSASLASAATPTLLPCCGTALPGAQLVIFQQGVGGYYGAEDTTLKYPDGNLHDVWYLNIGYKQKSSALIRFDLSSIPRGSRILCAALLLYAERWSGAPFSLEVGVYYAKRPWVSSEATWILASRNVPWQVAGCNGVDDRSQTPEDTFTIRNIDLWWHLNVTRIVEGWVNGWLPNYGMSLQAMDRFDTDDIWLASSDDVTADGRIENRPKLVVLYAPPPTPTLTATPSLTSLPTETPIGTATSTPGPTATPFASPTPEGPPTELPTPTLTPSSVLTPTHTPTMTPIGGPTPTDTPVVIPTHTSTATATAGPTLTPTQPPGPTPTGGVTDTPSPNPTATESPIATATPTATITPTGTVELTPQPTATGTPALTPTSTPSATTTPTHLPPLTPPALRVFVPHVVRNHPLQCLSWGYTFAEEFSSPALAGWSESMDGGQQLVSNGVLHQWTQPATDRFPLLWRNDLFEGAGDDFAFEARFRYTNFAAYGTTIALNSALFDGNRVPAGQPLAPGIEDILNIHHVVDPVGNVYRFDIAMFRGRVRWTGTPGDTGWHVVRITLEPQGTYTLYVDGQRIGSLRSAVRPLSIYIGNPTIQSWPGPWTQLYVDYVRISRCLVWGPY